MIVTLDKDFCFTPNSVPVIVPAGTEVTLPDCDEENIDHAAQVVAASGIPVNLNHKEGDSFVVYLAGGKRSEIAAADYRTPEQVAKTVAEADASRDALVAAEAKAKAKKK